MNVKPILTFADIPDLMTMDVEPIEWIVDGFISRKSMTLWAGSDGTAKTFLAQKMSIAVATGGQFLGRSCRETTVLYLDYENPSFAVKERLELMAGGAIPKFRIWGTWLEQEPPAIGSDLLLQIARQERPLMIVDPFRYAHAADENDATEMMVIMQSLRRYAAAGAAVVILHHPAKAEGSTGRGSTAIRGAVDIAFFQELSEETDLITLRCVKNRFGERPVVTIRPYWDEGRFEVVESPEFAKRTAEAERLEEIIRETPGLSQNQVIEKSVMKRARAIELLKAHAGSLWERREDGRSVRYFPVVVPETGNHLRNLGTDEVSGNGSLVPSLKGEPEPYRTIQISSVGNQSGTDGLLGDEQLQGLKLAIAYLMDKGKEPLALMAS